MIGRLGITRDDPDISTAGDRQYQHIHGVLQYRHAIILWNNGSGSGRDEFSGHVLPKDEMRADSLEGASIVRKIIFQQTLTYRCREPKFSTIPRKMSGRLAICLEINLDTPISTACP